MDYNISELTIGKLPIKNNGNIYYIRHVLCTSETDIQTLYTYNDINIIHGRRCAYIII